MNEADDDDDDGLSVVIVILGFIVDGGVDGVLLLLFYGCKMRFNAVSPPINHLFLFDFIILTSQTCELRNTLCCKTGRVYPCLNSCTSASNTVPNYIRCT